VEDAVQHVRELERRDRNLASAIAELETLESEVEAIRSRAAELAHVLSSLPERRTELLEHRAAALAELDCRRQALVEASAEHEEAERRGSEERIAAAWRALTRSEDSVAAGEARLGRVTTEEADLEAEAEAAERERPELASRAADVARRLRTAPRISARVDPGDDLVDWGSRARAALFLARTGLEREREQIIREAVELGTASLGEPLYGSTVAAVRRRLEERATA